VATKVAFEFDPFELVGRDRSEATQEQRRQILDQVANYVLESVLSDVGDSRSPVTGRPFKKLDSDYAKQKRSEGGTPVANLLLGGDLLDSLLVRKKGEKLILTVSEDQMGKADGHNNFSGDSPLPRRQFVPEEDETFRPAIRAGIEAIIDDVLGG